MECWPWKGFKVEMWRARDTKIHEANNNNGCNDEGGEVKLSHLS